MCASSPSIKVTMAGYFPIPDQIIIPCIDVKFERRKLNSGQIVVDVELALLDIPVINDGVSLHIELSNLIMTQQSGTKFVIKSRFDEIIFVGILKSFTNTSEELFTYLAPEAE